jgi:hypothetical protein
MKNKCEHHKWENIKVMVDDKHYRMDKKCLTCNEIVDDFELSSCDDCKHFDYNYGGIGIYGEMENYVDWCEYKNWENDHVRFDYFDRRGNDCPNFSRL